MKPYPVAVLVTSDRCAAGEREDQSGPAARNHLVALGYAVESVDVVPDDAAAIREKLLHYVTQRIPLVITSGGTGFSPRDVTPEATAEVVDRVAPGLSELIRRETQAHTPFASLSRGMAGIRDHTLIINLPGSPKGVVQSLDVLHKLLPHALHVVRGGAEGHTPPPEKPA